MEGSGQTACRSEQVLRDLRALYAQYGYRHYKMSKFEEYDLYVENKSFLVSDHIITFNDTNGRLMALKPDVTLSIVKNSKGAAQGTEKVYYHENVYRVAGGAHEFKEIMQTGLECIGDIDRYAASEVVLLAAKSLQAISPRYLLDLSHMGLVTGLLDSTRLTAAQKDGLLRCIRDKNAHGLRRLCADCGVNDDLTEKLAALATLYGPFESALPQARALSVGPATDAALDELEQLYALLKLDGCGDRICLDFSVVNDLSYYNGLMFRGFVDGLPQGVLSGGRYDNLLRKFGKPGGAIGFAVYLDQLERLDAQEPPYDVDVLLLYDQADDVAALVSAVRQLVDGGESVRVQKADDGRLRCRRLLRMKEGRAVEVGTA